MGDIERRKTRDGVRYYVRGFIDVDTAGVLKRNRRLAVDEHRYPVTERTQAWAVLAELEQEAKARAKRIRDGIAEPTPEMPAAAPLTVNQLADEFIAKYDRPGRIKNVKRYRKDAKWQIDGYVRGLIGVKLARDVTQDDVERIRDAVLAKGRSPQTTVHVMKVISRMYRWGRKKKLIDCTSPTQDVERPKVLLPKPDFYTKEELQRLFAEAELRGMPHIFPVVAIAAYTGLRMTETSKVCWSDVDLGRGLIFIAGEVTKNGEPATVEIGPELDRILRQWREQCPASKEGWVIPIIKKRGKTKTITRRANHSKDLNLKPLLEAAGCHVPKKWFHALRHSFATHLADGGTNVFELQAAGRWKTMSQVERYAHPMRDRIRAQVARLNFAPPSPADVSSLADARARRAAGVDTQVDMEHHTAPASGGERR
jgi:integrase